MSATDLTLIEAINCSMQWSFYLVLIFFMSLTASAAGNFTYNIMYRLIAPNPRRHLTTALVLTLAYLCHNHITYHTSTLLDDSRSLSGAFFHTITHTFSHTFSHTLTKVLAHLTTCYDDIILYVEEKCDLLLEHLATISSISVRLLALLITVRFIFLTMRHLPAVVDCLKKIPNGWYALENSLTKVCQYTIPVLVNSLLYVVGLYNQAETLAYINNKQTYMEQLEKDLKLSLTEKMSIRAMLTAEYEAKIVEMEAMLHDGYHRESGLKATIRNLKRGIELSALPKMPRTPRATDSNDFLGRDQRELLQAKSQERRLRKEIIQLQAQEERLQGELAKGKAQEDRIEKELLKSKAREERLQAELIAREERLQMELIKVQAAMHQLEQSNQNGIETVRQEAVSTISGLNAECQDLKGQLITAHDNWNQTKEALQAAIQLNSSLQGQVEAVSLQIRKDVQAEAEARSAQIVNDLQRQVENMSVQISLDQNELQNASQIIKDLQDRNRSLESRPVPPTGTMTAAFWAVDELCKSLPDEFEPSWLNENFFSSHLSSLFRAALENWHHWPVQERVSSHILKYCETLTCTWRMFMNSKPDHEESAGGLEALAYAEEIARRGEELRDPEYVKTLTDTSSLRTLFSRGAFVGLDYNPLLCKLLSVPGQTPEFNLRVLDFVRESNSFLDWLDCRRDDWGMPYDGWPADAAALVQDNMRRKEVFGWRRLSQHLRFLLEASPIIIAYKAAGQLGATPSSAFDEIMRFLLQNHGYVSNLPVDETRSHFEGDDRISMSLRERCLARMDRLNAIINQHNAFSLDQAILRDIEGDDPTLCKWEEEPFVAADDDVEGGLEADWGLGGEDGGDGGNGGDGSHTGDDSRVDDDDVGYTDEPDTWDLRYQ